MDKPNNKNSLKLRSQQDTINRLISPLATETEQKTIEKILTKTFELAPDNIIPNSDKYYAVLNYQLYRYALKHYKHKEDKICFWRFIKCLSYDQLNYENKGDPDFITWYVVTKI